jgi:hypothetical protein
LFVVLVLWRRFNGRKQTVLTFTAAQLAQVEAAVALLAQHARDNFMRSLAGMLDGITRPTDGQLIAALCELLAMRGVAVGRRAFMAPNQTNKQREAR